MRLKNIFLLAALFVSATLIAQQPFDSAPNNWYNMDYETDNIRGVSTEKAYKELLQGKKSTPIIVAIIDSGVDTEHEDLKDVMWVNKKEIAGNGRDDDRNGYVDDIHGWSFLGSEKGDVDQDNLEITRLYRKYNEKYKDVNPTSLKSPSEVNEYAYYLTLKKRVTKKRESAMRNLESINERVNGFINGVNKIEKQLGGDSLSIEDLSKVEVGEDTELGAGVGIATNFLSGADGGKLSYDDLRDAINKALGRAVEYYDSQANAHYNPDFDPRHIVNDDYDNQREIHYGSNSYRGPDASHGTHVAGIVAATRNNDIGVNGVADNVLIMTVRAVPDGDERDKDIAAAIRYAVDNGASVINMSFGKGYSWDKKVVDDAVRHAVKNDVLLVHAAGNSSQNNDIEENYPRDAYEKAGLFQAKKASSWLEVGALNWQGGKNSPAPFTNYGKKAVDVFAPGVDINSTIPDNEYAKFSGTSMASPVVAGVAALIRSYYPMLTADQVKEIIMTTAVPLDFEVIRPGTKDDMVHFSELSKTGAVVNAYEALKKADTVKGKRKVSISEKL